jgi:DNA-binding FadR family transcriptional regulator
VQICYEPRWLDRSGTGTLDSFQRTAFRDSEHHEKEERVRRPRTPAGVSDGRFRPVARSRVADRVAEQLLQLIAERRLGPGETLPGERQLAQLMGVSRASVRGALEQLRAQDLLSSTRGAGTRLRPAAAELAAPPPAVEPGLLAQLASELLAASARYAAARPDGREALARALRGPEAPATDMDLLERIVAAGGSELVRRIFAPLRQVLAAALRPDDAAAGAELRRELQRAIEAGNGAAIAAALRRRFDRPVAPALVEEHRLAAE